MLAVSCAYKVTIKELCIAFGVGKSYQHTAVHQIAAQLGPTCSSALPAFHAFSGCDCVSFFCGIRKTKAWNTWAIYPNITKAFLAIMQHPSEQLLPEHVHILERAVCLAYDRASELHLVDQARQSLFTRAQEHLENVPPTSAAFCQHKLRAKYQSGHIWGQCLVKDPVLQSAASWGWQRGEASESSPRSAGSVLCPWERHFIPIFLTPPRCKRGTWLQTVKDIVEC